MVFAGDSVGASLCLSLVQVVLAARRQQKTAKPTVLFHGWHVELKMLSGLALLCVAPDQTASLPSWTINASSDIFEDTLPALNPSSLPVTCGPPNRHEETSIVKFQCLTIHW